MSTPKSDDIIVQKPRSNVYTMMLILSFIALLVACLVLWLEIEAYGGFPTPWKTTNASDLQQDVPTWASHLT